MRPARTMWRNWRSVAAVLGAIGLIVAGLAISIVNEGAYRGRKAGYLTAQAQVLAATVEPALVFFDAAAAREAVAAVQANADIEGAGVYQMGGGLIAWLGAAQSLPKSPAANGRADYRDARMSVAVPVRHEGETIGTVYLRTTPESWISRLGRHGGTALLLVMAVVVLAAVQSSQAALARAARETEARAAELARLNAALQDQVQRRETAEEALRQAQKMETLGQLTGGIAHDFNNLLQGVQGSLDLISRKPEDPARVARWASAGLEAAERGARLTAQLLAFSRAQKLELRALDVAEVAGRLRPLLPNTMGPKVRVVFDLDEQAPPAVADSTQLELAVLNLCINARDAMPNGGEIVVRTRSETLAGDAELPDGDYLVLSVSDTGVGMPEDVRGRAFDPFFTTKGLGKGTGLGLAQVYGIAKQAGGAARIESAPDRGTTVSIYLPQADQAPDAAPQREAGDAPVVVGARVLVVDDDPGVRGYVVDALTNLGYAPAEAEDGESGLAALEEGSFDLLILDYAMPGLTGAEVATRALARHPRLPILFASGYAESEALEAAVGRAAPLLRKPFDTQTLARRVHETIAAAGKAA